MKYFAHIFMPMIMLAMSLAPAIDAHGDALLVPEEYATITEAIDAAQNGDVIEVAAGVYTENLYLYDKQIAIRGAGHGEKTIIDGGAPANDMGSCIFVGAGTGKLVLESVTLRNGIGYDIFGIRRGGGIYSEYGEVELIDVVIEGCSVGIEEFSNDAWGGAVCNYGGSLIVVDCIFEGNTSDGGGGAIWSSMGSISITDSSIIGNQAMRGGGIEIDSSITDINRVNFCDNTAMERGGGILLLEVYPSGVGIGGSRFDSNAAEQGSAIWISSFTTLLESSVFSRNTSAKDDGAIHVAWIDTEPILIGGNAFCGSNAADITGDGPWDEFEPNSYQLTCPQFGDLNGDGVVSGADLTILLSSWGTNGLPYGADLDCDGVVGGSDLTILLASWSA